MNEDIKKKWVAALRSGEYSQTTGCLRKGNNYCCLGVLCDLYHQDGHGEWHETVTTFNALSTSDFYYNPGAGDGPNRSCLPSSIWKNAGLQSNGGALPLGVIEKLWKEYKDIPAVNTLSSGSDLTSLNDQGFTFSQIADIIEKYL